MLRVLSMLGIYILMLVQNRKYQKNQNFCILGQQTLSSLGSSQFRFQYQSFRL